MKRVYSMMNLVYIIDAYKYITAVVYYGLLLTITIILIRAAGLQPLVVIGLMEPPPTSETTIMRSSARTYHTATVAATLPTAPQAIPIGTVWPLHGMVTTQFGSPDLPYQSSHTGIDISDGKPSGISDVVAFKSGTVIHPAGNMYGYGNLVAIDHGNGLVSYYGHLASSNVGIGQIVHTGDSVGKEGSTGNSTGPHVHFEVRLNNIPVNPRDYVGGNP